MSDVMREEVKAWWRQALKDLDAAEKNFEIGEYYLVAFLCQQSVEKALKAFYIQKLKKATTTHSLIYLGKSVGVPKELEKTLRDLTPDFVVSRYPDVAQEVPYELYDEDIAKEKLNGAKKVIGWVKEEFESHGGGL
jgi:HEPN domain-containing protein